MGLLVFFFMPQAESTELKLCDAFLRHLLFHQENEIPP